MQSDDFYMVNYQYTIQKDCDSTEVMLGDNFKSFVCTREVNFGNFYVRGVYKIHAITYNDEELNTIVVCLSKSAEKPNDTNAPNDISGLKSESINNPSTIVAKYISILRNSVDKLPMDFFDAQINKANYQKVLKKMATNILENK